MYLAVAEGLEPSVSGLTIRRLTNLATPQDFSGGDEGIRTLIDRFTRPTLWEPFELHRPEKTFFVLVLCTLFFVLSCEASVEPTARR